MEKKESVLVYGAGGEQGGAVARKLLQEGLSVRLSARQAEKVEPLRALGAEWVPGGYEDPDSLRKATSGVQKVVFQLPLEYDEAKAVAYGKNIIDAAKDANVQKIVFNASSIVPEGVDLVAIRIKRRVIEHLRDSGIPYLVVKPTVYMENLLGPWTAPAIVNNQTFAYPIPADMPVSWIALEDVAAFISKALRNERLNGAELQIGGPQPLTGVEVASLLSRRLGKPIHYYPIPLDGFEQSLSAAIGPDAAKAVTDLYRWQSELPSSPLVAGDMDDILKQLPVQLTSLEQFIQKTRWEAYEAGAERGSA
ncbi:SDR family oxidoreductase [Paenibacillus sp.]|uniref:SDR family oxidoreductase n=1 Tax=Paenibacillus sp. TaxID=58172 RepID=UPI002D33300A|nr:NmrA family NAD(P)-binding protein [Paenibacillus sp.]HZG58506.1 NmrA family NAD(P)-binding protein [Paenibacillus sp.]